ncbi:retrovirus-related pol polyprotein from transposon TNT 1-94, partial [Tanacetum coccineum]
MLSSTRVKCSTSNCGSKPLGNKKNDRISQTPSSNKKNKVEAQPRKVNKMNRVVKPICDVDVNQSLSNENSDILCATCNKSMFDGIHDKCLLDLVQNENNRTKSAKKHKKQNVWKPTSHVFTKVGFKWKPTGRTFTIVGNSCLLTWFTSTNVVPPKQTTSHSDDIQKLELKVYTKKPKNVKNIGSRKIAKILESKNANQSEPNQTWGSNATDIPSSSFLVMTGCPDCILGLGHNLFSVGQFCDADLEVAFWKITCFICNLEGVDLLSGSRDTNLYTISLDDMLKSSPICLLSKASKTKSWLWHRRLSHLNFGTLNKLAKDSLTRGIPRLKFLKDHLCSVCALGKSKKTSHQPKVEDINKEKLNLLHMDLCGPMCVASINGKRTPYELMQDKKPNLSFFHVFGSLCYPTNDHEDVGKFDAKVDIGIFVGYAPAKKAFRIYNRRTRIITETIHVTFDELTAMASEQFSLGPGLQGMTLATPSFEESPKTPTFHDDPLNESPNEDSTSHGSSSNVRQIHTPLEHLSRWTKDHPIANVIGDPSCFVSTRKQLEMDAMWCCFDAFLTSVEPKNFKQEMTEPSWIDAMQEEIYEFERLEVWELV